LRHGNDTSIPVRGKRFSDRKKGFAQVVGHTADRLFTYLSSGEDYEDMALFARTHKEFLQPYVSLPHGIPSHDTFRRVFSVLEPEVLRECL
jgi:hypothetical protein